MCARIERAPGQAWPVERIASEVGVSSSRLHAVFRQAFGLPPHRYLLTRRIERAVALCRDTELPITEIALQTGWN
ncbi:AraC family transcriptional regulator, partial [Staphylococcus hominis]